MDTKDINALRNGEKILCENCGSGHYLPINPNYPATKQTHFVCSECGDLICFVLKMPKIR